MTRCSASHCSASHRSASHCTASHCTASHCSAAVTHYSVTVTHCSATLTHCSVAVTHCSATVTHCSVAVTHCSVALHRTKSVLCIYTFHYQSNNYFNFLLPSLISLEFVSYCMPRFVKFLFCELLLLLVIQFFQAIIYVSVFLR